MEHQLKTIEDSMVRRVKNRAKDPRLYVIHRMIVKEFSQTALGFVEPSSWTNFIISS